MTMRPAIAVVVLAVAGMAAACGGQTQTAAVTADGSIAVGPLLSEAPMPQVEPPGPRREPAEQPGGQAMPPFAEHLTMQRRFGVPPGRLGQ